MSTADPLASCLLSPALQTGEILSLYPMTSPYTPIWTSGTTGQASNAYQLSVLVGNPGAVGGGWGQRAGAWGRRPGGPKGPGLNPLPLVIITSP